MIHTRLYTAILTLCCVLAMASAIAAARVEVRRADGLSEFSTELGQTVDMEVFIDAEGEDLTGYSLYLSYDASLFALVPAETAADGTVAPFSSGNFLRGIPLINNVETIEDRIFLSYTEAAGGTSRSSVNGSGVALRFQLEVLQRSLTPNVSIRIEERGHDRISHYVTAAAPGVEERFATPLGTATVRITGFRILPLPDLTVIEGEAQEVFDLDDFVDTLSTEVLWTSSRLSEVPTAIDADTREVTMTPLAGFVGQRAMIFTAFEVSEGLTAADTVRITVLSRPRIADFPDTIRFAEDRIYQDLDFDAFASDVDHLNADLVWLASDAVNMGIEVEASSHVATFRPTADCVGLEEVFFIVSDPTALADTVSAVVEVTPVNDPPDALSSPPVYPLVEGGPVSVPLADLFTDRDDDVSSLQVFLAVEGGVRAEIVDGQLLIHGSETGRGIVRVTAQDSSGASVESRQVAVVLAPGQSVGPELDALPELRFLGGQTASLDLKERVVDDSPVDSLLWSVEVDSGLVASVVGGVLQVSGESGFAGSGNVVVTVTDPQGNSDSARLLASILRSEDDLGPRISAPAKIGLREGKFVQLLLDELVADPDDADELLTWQPFSTPGVLARFDADTRTLIVSATDAFISPAALSLVVSDPQGNTDEVAVPVLLALAGEPPQLAELPAVSLDSLNSAIELDLDDFAFDDVDRESELLWEIEPEPGIEVAFDPVTHDLVVKRDPDAVDLPLVTQVLVRVTDTNGQERTAIITVGLPPLFSLEMLPTIEIFPGSTDSSLVLQDYAVGGGGQVAPTLIWNVAPSNNISAAVDAQTTRLYLLLTNEGFTGAEMLAVTATDATGRSRVAQLQVVVKSAGLTPQIRAFPLVEVEEGQVDISIDLDDYVVDDDIDDTLIWSVSGQDLLAVTIDAATRVVTLDATAVPPSLERLQFVVRDPAGNSALGVMDVVVVRGGQAPEIEPLPQLLLLAGDKEQQLSLSSFVNDPDTPSQDLEWQVQAEPGIAARVEGDRLFVAIPAGETGSRMLTLTATDPQGNLTMAQLEVLIQQDARAPEFAVEVRRHPLFSDLVELHIAADEALESAPTVLVDGDTLSVVEQEDGSYIASFEHPAQQGERFVDVDIRASDRAGNEGVRQLEVGLAWMDEMGGNLRSPNPQLILNVADEAARPGQMAIVYRLGEKETPAGSENQEVFSLDLLRGRMLASPVTVNFLPGSGSDPFLGILRWDEVANTWEELPTSVDAQTGWLAATVEELGLFRLGRVDAKNRRESMPITGYPNPFVANAGAQARIEYRLSSPGEVRLQIYNTLGQPVRLLVEEFQEVGGWSVGWNGRDDQGMILGSGVYYYELSEGGRRHYRSLVLVR
ncbi:MAG: hypothetical protein ACI8PG_003862 [Planctomycetota bacterium]|jgi:hypothetical protein